MKSLKLSDSLSSSTWYNTLWHALLFVFGFSIVFIVGWGGAATLLGQLFGQYKLVLARVGGLLVILFGLHTLGIWRIHWLDYDTRPQWGGKKRNQTVSSLLMGIVFAAGWTPCVGTTLGAILTLGLSQDTAGQAMILASGYALGLGLPFLVIGAGIHWALTWLQRLRPYLRYIQIISGIFLISIGLLLITNQLTLIAIWAQQNGYFLDLPLGAATTPSYLIAILAGLLSFLSPCVLPLVPAYIGHLSGQMLNTPTSELMEN